MLQVEQPSTAGRQAKLLFWAGILLTGVGVLAGGCGNIDGYRVEPWSDEASGQLPLQGRFYLSIEPAEPPPGVLLCHGANNSKETMTTLALEFVRRGYAVLAFDFGGHGESASRPPWEDANVADIQRAAAALARHPEVDGRRLAFVGHSMGARSAASVAWNQENVLALVSLGMTFPAQTDRPRNLLFGAGLYDQLHSPAAMRSALQAAVGTEQANAGIRYGDFSQGDARELVFSTQVDHILEPFDPVLLQRSVQWVDSAISRHPIATVQPRAHWLPVSWAAYLLGAVCLTTAAGQLVLARVNIERLREALFRRSCALFGAALCLVPMAASWVVPAPDYFWADASLALLLALLLNDLFLNLHARSGLPLEEILRRVLGFAGRMAALGGLAWLGGLLLLRLPVILDDRDAVLGIPGLVLQQPLYFLCYSLMKMRLLLFASYSEQVMPSFALVGLLLVEVVFPGAVLVLLMQGVQRLVHMVRWERTHELTPEPTAEGKSLLGARLLAIALLLIVLVLVWQLTQLAGFNWELVLMLAQIAFALVVLPLIVLGLLINFTPLGRRKTRLPW